MKAILRILLLLALTLSCLVELFVFLGKTWWFFELFTHYSAYYALLASLELLAFLLYKNWRLALLAATLLAINLGTLSPYFHSETALQAQYAQNTPSEKRILALNFYYENTHFEEFAELLAQENPDIFVIHEAGEQWREGMLLFQEEYPYFYLTQKTGVHGILIASKTPGLFQEIPLGHEVGLLFTPQEGSLHILGVHPLAPITQAYAKERNLQLQDLANYVNGKTHTLVIGDFNATPWSPYVKELLKETGLIDSRLNRGLIPTWHAHSIVFHLPIDLALLTPDLAVNNFYASKALYSDHLPIVLELSIL